MNSSFLYHAWGLYNLECSREEYKSNTIFLYTHSKKPQTKCPKCGNCHLVKNGYRYRDFLALSIGGRRVVIRMKVQRYKCKHKGCDYDRQEKIPLCYWQPNLYPSFCKVCRGPFSSNDAKGRCQPSRYIVGCD
ncbi:transposase family protein [Prevotella sp. S7 MS 2]|uniref:transposase family protein n=1 Tax=Prevotella sp. S7 MS 2 TaxID=1287488 RepID=UPI001E651C38|nr:transposase family protein [Prevotella sp. S7 MS 2]